MQNPDTALPCITDSLWSGGVNSLLFPTDLAQGQYAWGVNIINRGGLVQTRPGRNRIFTFPGKKAQGFTIFFDSNANYWMIAAIDGMIWASQFPFVTRQQLGFVFDPFAEQIFFAQGIQAAKYNPDGSLSLIEPIRWLLIQDGINSPGWWDPVNVQTVQKAVVPRLPGTQPIGYVPTLPIGRVMVWTDNRLWLAVGSKVLASDIFQPFAFLEGTYLSEADGFGFPFNVSSMVPAPEDTGLYVCTPQTIGQLDSQIQDRTQWQLTPQFQSTLTPELGCDAPFGIQYAHGLLWLYSNKGLISVNNALQSQITSVMYTQDGEMARSRNRLSPHRNGVALGLFENLLLCAVPSSSLYNRHCWVMDGDIASMLMSQQPPCWTGIWTGSWPVQFGRLIDQGVEHIYELSYSSGTVTDPISGKSGCGIHVFELISPNQYDTAGNVITPIRCQWESRMLAMPDEQWYAGAWVEIFLVGLKGYVEFELWIAGMSGQYIQIGVTHFQANIGPFGDPSQGTIYYQVTGQPTSIANNFKSQLRYVRGPDLDTSYYQNSPHNVETDRNDDIDKGFQVVLKWTGVCGVRKIKFYYRKQTESSRGGLPLAEQDETGESNIVFESVA